MDTPEGDVSALESGAIEPLPLYVEHEDAFRALLTRIASSANAHHLILDQYIEDEAHKPIECYPTRPEPERYPLTRIKQSIVNEFYHAIRREDGEVVTLLINNNLVTANTTSEAGGTPLLEAIGTKNVSMVKWLLDFGADPNAFGLIGFGSSTQANRTPLMLAASMGHLPLVKFLMEECHCDDSLVAPDGQIALRLAIANRHREVVDYLPARRGGGLLRWKTQHQKEIRRAKKALTKIFQFLKFFLWDIEKFLLWKLPKHAIVIPLKRACVWCWENRKKFPAWLKSYIQQIPIRIWEFCKSAWKDAKAILKATWKFSTKTLPRWLKKCVLWVWNVLTKRIPQAIQSFMEWIRATVMQIGKAVWNIILKIASLLHTAFHAVITFFSNLTLKDIWHGFCDLLRGLFITLPKAVWFRILAFGDAISDIMKSVFGSIGECIRLVVVWIVVGVTKLVTYVPRKLFVIAQSLGNSMRKGFYEIAVWVNPKM